jgi:hypothetical protein
MVGNGTGNVVPLAEASNGQLVIGSTGNAPVLAALASADSSVTITNTAGAIDLAVPASGAFTINAQTGTTYTLLLTDQNKLVTLDNAAAITCTIPPNSSVAFPIGTQIALYAKGAGDVTPTAGAGVTIRCRGAATKSAGQYAMMSLVKNLSDTWILSGDCTT